MNKPNRIKILIPVGVLIVIIVIVVLLVQTCGKESAITDVGETTSTRETIIVNGEEESISSENGETLDNTTNSESPTKVDDVISSEDISVVEKTTSVDETTGSNKPIGENESTSSEETMVADNPTSAERPTSSGKPVNTEKPTISEQTTIADKPASPEVPTTSEKPAIPEETETVENSSFKITLTAPEIVLVNTTFTLSVDATNCAHIEWYINGEYDAELDKKINPTGSLQFTKTGIYRITVIGYSEDWSENVMDSKAVRVYNDLSQANGNAKEHDRAMYSWGHHYIYEENEAILQDVMERTECNILYQEVASNASADDVAAFLQRRGEHNQTVYYLCGNATWSIEEGATSMLREVDRAIAYNNAAGEHKFVGIQFDVEPYCLEDFDANADEYMAQYVENSKLAYAKAHEAGLLVEICIPYWWDSAYGYDEQLEDLIANACDSVAVMNYYKKQKEAEHIENEVELCKKYNKKITNITETIPPGLHGLTEDNTYYNDGIDAIEEMWNILDGYFQYDKLGYSFHYLDEVIKLLDRN